MIRVEGRKHLALLLTAAMAFGSAQPAFAYLKFGVRVGSRQLELKWAQTQTPVRYFVSNNAAVTGVTVSEFQAAVGRAFDRWQAVPTASIAYQFGGFTVAQPGSEDGASTLGFLNRPEMDRVLASTSFRVDAQTGALIESDIFFNTAFPWSVANGGEANRFDLESIAVHEIGHLSGLGHSALGETISRAGGGRTVTSAEAVMFPIAFGVGSTVGRTLRADDIAGISDLYPDGDFPDLGSVSGRVTRDGRGVFGAHVVAFDPATRKLIATFTLNDNGEFSMSGLSPGPQIIRIEPLDDADTTSFFDASRTIDVDFLVTFHDRVVVVPRRGDTGSIQLTVRGK